MVFIVFVLDFRTIPTVWYFFLFFSLSLNVIYIFLYFKRKVKDDYRLFKKLNIPGPDPVMVLGSIHEFRDKVCKYESQIRKGSDFFPGWSYNVQNNLDI